MNLRINSNVLVLNSHRNMTATSNLKTKNLEKLSSSLNINRGADGPAKLQISEHLKAQEVPAYGPRRRRHLPQRHVKDAHWEPYKTGPVRQNRRS